MLTLKVKNIQFEDGEEFKLLIDAETLEPMLEPNLYAVRKLRNKNDAANTIGKKLRDIAVLYTWIEEEKRKANPIDLVDQFARLEYLNEGELNSLLAFCELNFDLWKPTNITTINPKKIVRQRKTNKISKIVVIDTPSVSSDTLYTRITNIAAYLRWLATYEANNSQQRVDFGTRSLIKEMYGALLDGRGSRKRATRKEPKSLTEEEQKEVVRIFEIDSEDNPTKRKDVQVRNKLIFSLLYHLGLRIGEMLGIKLGDIDIKDGLITIHRRPDDVEDKRMGKPQAKTDAGDVPINKNLARMINQYIIRYRSKVKGHDDTPFLIISHHASKSPEGAALSATTINKFFRKVRESSPILKEFTPHMLRHTWNVNFSDFLDNLPTEKKFSPEEEMASRNKLQRWKDDSKQGAHYAKRHIQKKANEVSMAHQKTLIEKLASNQKNEVE